ncbi:MAG: nucleotidyltransferase family protein [Oscillospiraceae bacterium]
MSAAVCAVLLASGFSRRFGENKLLHPVEGTPLFLRAFAAVPAALFLRAAVVSQYEELLQTAAKSGYLPLRNSHPEEGISSSLRLGLSGVADGADGVLFAVCDQPYLTAESVQRLVARFQQDPTKIAALSAQHRRGNPVIFPADLFGELFALTGDTGGSAVIKKHPHRLATVEVPPRELSDMDYRL